VKKGAELTANQERAAGLGLAWTQRLAIAMIAPVCLCLAPPASLAAALSEANQTPPPYP
jgi:hypothetical protein